MNQAHLLKRCTIFAATFLVVFLNYGAAAQDSTSAEAWPDWMQKAMAAEKRKLRFSKVSLGDGYLTTRMAGKPIGKPQELEGGWYLSSNIGADAALECWFFSTPVDPATLATNIASASMQSSEQANGRLDNQSIHFVDAGAYDSAPYLALEWFYSVGEAPNTLVGLAKVRVAAIDGATVGCAHNLVGYRETFADAFEKLVREAQVSSNEPAHYYEEVVVQKISGQPVGFAHTTFTRDAEGDTNIVMQESMIIPVDGSTLSTTDSWHSSFSRTDGSLINQVTATSENGELITQLALDPIEDGTWSVSGVFQGKEVYEEIAAVAGPMSEIGQMRAVQHLLTDSEKSSVTMNVWIPAADPTRFLEAGVSMGTDGRDEGYGTLTLGPMAIAAQFDQAGSLLNGRLDAGATQMVMERVWADGTPP